MLLVVCDVERHQIFSIICISNLQKQKESLFCFINHIVKTLTHAKLKSKTHTCNLHVLSCMEQTSDLVGTHAQLTCNSYS